MCAISSLKSSRSLSHLLMSSCLHVRSCFSRHSVQRPCTLAVGHRRWARRLKMVCRRHCCTRASYKAAVGSAACLQPVGKPFTANTSVFYMVSLLQQTIGVGGTCHHSNTALTVLLAEEAAAVAAVARSCLRCCWYTDLSYRSAVCRLPVSAWPASY